MIYPNGTHNRNLKDLSADKSQISANAETSLNSDIKLNSLRENLNSQTLIVLRKRQK